MSNDRVTFRFRGLDIRQCKINEDLPEDLHVLPRHCQWDTRLLIDIKPAEESGQMLVSFSYKLSYDHKRKPLQLMHLAATVNFHVSRRGNAKAKLDMALFLGNYSGNLVQGFIADVVNQHKLPCAFPQMSEQIQSTKEFRKVIKRKWK